MRITHDSLIETTDPETPALLRLTLTPSTIVVFESFLNHLPFGSYAESYQYFDNINLKIWNYNKLEKGSLIDIRSNTSKTDR